MPGSHFQVGNPQSFQQILGDTSTEFFPLVCDYVHRDSDSALPVVEDGSSHGGSLFVGEHHELYIFGEGIGDAKDKFLPVFICFKRSEEISVDPLVGFCWLRQAGDEIGHKGGHIFPHLTMMTHFLGVQKC